MTKEFVIERTRLGNLQSSDYQIMTYSVWNENSEKVPYGRYFKKDSSVAFYNKTKEEIGRMLKQHAEKGGIIVQETRPLLKNQDVYLLETNWIDFDTAVDCGLGIIQYNDVYYLYNSENNLDDVALAIDIYLQIVVDVYHNETLINLIKNKEKNLLLSLMISTDDGVLIRELEQSLVKKKKLKI